MNPNLVFHKIIEQESKTSTYKFAFQTKNKIIEI